MDLREFNKNVNSLGKMVKNVVRCKKEHDRTFLFSLIAMRLSRIALAVPHYNDQCFIDLRNIICELSDRVWNMVHARLNPITDPSRLIEKL